MEAYNGLERLLKAVPFVLQIMCLFTFKLKIQFLGLERWLSG